MPLPLGARATGGRDLGTTIRDASSTRKADFKISPRVAQKRWGGSKDLPPLPALRAIGTVLMRSIGGGCRPLEERGELRGGPELRDGVELLERARKRVGEAPFRPRSEFLHLRIEIHVVDAAG